MGPYRLRLLTLKRHYSINSSYGGLPVSEGLTGCANLFRKGISNVGQFTLTK